MVHAITFDNSSVSGRIDDMGRDVKQQLTEKLKSHKFSLQIQKCTIWKRKAQLLEYVRYIDEEKFQEEMLFFQSPETTTRAVDIYKKLHNYFDKHEVSQINMTLLLNIWKC